MGQSVSILTKSLAWLKFQLLKLAVWKISAFWPWRKRLPKVLILRPDNLGDFLITLSSCQQLCDHFHAKGYEITILVASKNQAIAEACPLFDHVIAYDIYRDDFSQKKRLAMYRWLYAERFSIVVNPYVMASQNVLSHFITFLCRPAISANALNTGVVSRLTTQTEQYLWTTRWIDHYSVFLKDNASSLMETEHHLAQRICGENFPLTLYNRGFGELPAVSLPESYYVLVPGTISHAPWPMHNVTQLMVNIHEKWPDLTPVLTGAPNEKHLVEEIRQNLPASIPFIDKVGDSTLLELFSIIRNAHFVVTNDTGTAHLAPLFSVPTVVILGGGHIGAYLPNPLYTKMQCVTHPMDCFNCGWNCKRHQDGVNLCIASVSVDDVMAAIEKIM
ncbi:MAG: hypothetical protein K6G44_13185 [Lentisphaeria bacterium]|nr:hypothetical protein [Lentisphaeria bacterium]